MLALILAPNLLLHGQVVLNTQIIRFVGLKLLGSVTRSGTQAGPQKKPCPGSEADLTCLGSHVNGKPIRPSVTALMIGVVIMAVMKPMESSRLSVKWVVRSYR